MLPEIVITQIKAQSILDIALHCLPALKKKGHEYTCHCPFHSERTPSFTINTDGNYFKCFGCDAKGDAITFIQRFNSLSFQDACLFLASFYNIGGTSHGSPVNFQRPAPKVLPPIQYGYIPLATAQATMKSYESNTLCIWLASVFGWPTALHLASLYQLGTTKAGECIYWQVATDGRISGGKIRAHDIETGKGLNTSWAHSKMNLKGVDGQKFNITPCLFGAHLIATGKPIALVEGERTAVVMAHIMPNFTWLATGGAKNFKPEILVALKGIPVNVFPDAGFLDGWKADAMKFNDAGYQFKMSTLLEKALHEGRAQKNDDFLDFILRPAPQATPTAPSSSATATAENYTHYTPSSTATAEKSTMVDILPKTESTPQAEKSAIADNCPTLSPIGDQLVALPQTESAPQAEIGTIAPLLPGHKGVERIIANLQLLYTGTSEYTPEHEKVPHSAPNWLISEIQDIRAYYASATLPKAPIWLGEGEIHDIQAFTSSHLEYLSGTSSPSVKRPYLDRLKRLKVLLDLGYPMPPF